MLYSFSYAIISMCNILIGGQEMSKLFGTDGVRGIANKDLTPELAYKLGRAGGHVLRNGRRGKVIVGRDTRKSGEMLEAALTAGLCSVGLDVVSVGVVPTPAVAFLTKNDGALGGVVISASHNPAEYNGIKFFGDSGYKLNGKIEERIEELILTDLQGIDRPIGEDIGIRIEDNNGKRRYMDFLKTTIDVDLKDIKVAMDCGNGAVSDIAPELIEELGAEVVAINTEPDGLNINKNCGSTNPSMIKELVKEIKADIGLSFDGDADRLIAVDNKGELLDGDHIIAICGTDLKEKGKLKNNTVVGTIMTNMGLDDYLKTIDVDIVKTKVGDKYVLEEMVENNYVLGGEQSGHMIFLEYNTTGDGLLTGLQLIKVMIEKNEELSELNRLMVDYPQVLINAKVKEELKHSYLEDEEIKERIDKIEEIFHGEGRVIIRPSGTEPLVRVMIEAKDGENIKEIAQELADFIETKLG